MTRIAFYAPMKAPHHPTPSGDREIARLTLGALEQAGFSPFVVSSLRTLDLEGSATRQRDHLRIAQQGAQRILERTRKDPPALWFTYHCYYKAPDLLGPSVSRALGIPYAISEPSISRKRRNGPWTTFANASDTAIAAADRLYWTTRRDFPALAEAGHESKMVHLPAFVDPGPAPTAPPPSETLRLLTVAMMRPGDKLDSYRRIAAALEHLTGDWQLTIIGDGFAQSEVKFLLEPFGDRVTYQGAIDDPPAIRAAYEAADVLLWPGVGEGVGMVYLEAQAAGLPVAAEAHAAQMELIAAPLAPVGDARALADLAMHLGALPDARTTARQHAVARHSLNAAAAILRETLGRLL